tara:strand:+ start:1476 stop:1655 length:180 start_codon:yes stop_codon:yes gene_type:complete
MKRFKNQNIFHATTDNKRTICGLSNELKVADTILEFSARIKKADYKKYCCKKCQLKINN